MTDEASTAGWDAIDTAFNELYGEQEPKHYGTAIPYALGGPDPLDGISAYIVEHSNASLAFCNVRLLRTI